MESLNPAIKVARRSKAENYARPFECGCGKSYLSYSALYTHIKNKHEGEPPAGTSPLPSKMKRRRGRPRKAILGDITNHIISFDSDSVLLEESGLLGSTSDFLSLFENPELPLFGHCQQWLDASEELKQSKESHTCDDVFALYLIDLRHTVAPEGFKQFAECLHHFRECLNEFGWEVFDLQPVHGAGAYSTCNGAQDLPNLCNHFIVKYLPEHTSLVREEAIVFALQFTLWLFTNEYTSYKLNMIDYSRSAEHPST